MKAGLRTASESRSNSCPVYLLREEAVSAIASGPALASIAEPRFSDSMAKAWAERLAVPRFSMPAVREAVPGFAPSEAAPDLTSNRKVTMGRRSS